MNLLAYRGDSEHPSSTTVIPCGSRHVQGGNASGNDGVIAEGEELRNADVSLSGEPLV